jgi:DNA polymerase-3 subunit epsilon
LAAGFLKRLLPWRLLRSKGETWPEPLRQYMSQRKRLAKQTPLDRARFVVFDTETTGLDLSKNRLLSIAGVGVEGLEVRLGDAFEAMVAQTDVGGADAAVIHGLVSSDLGGGLPEDEAAARFLAFAGNSILVAQHAAFDIRMLRKAIAKHRGARVWSPSIDTAQLARRVEGRTMSSGEAHGVDARQEYQLDSLIARYDVETPDRHTAAGDALATALLFQKLLKKAERRGIQTVGELLAR